MTLKSIGMDIMVKKVAKVNTAINYASMLSALVIKKIFAELLSLLKPGLSVTLMKLIELELKLKRNLLIRTVLVS